MLAYVEAIEKQGTITIDGYTSNKTIRGIIKDVARAVEERGYDFQTALDSIDFGRTTEEEQMEITQEEIDELVDVICSSFEQERD